MADRKALLCRQVIGLLKFDGYFLLIFTEKRLRNPVEGRVFIPAGYFDESAFVPALVNIYIESVRYCISEKSSKINQYLSRYKEWWLVLLDYLGEGLDEIEKGEVLSKISTLGNFDKVFVISADGKRHLISILKS